VPLPSTCWTAAFTPDSRRIASGGVDGVVRVWELTTGRECLALQGGAGSVNNVCFRPDGRELSAAGSAGKVRIWEIKGSD
jgi:WD40 repeat protein